jgi:hypothetical protein
MINRRTFGAFLAGTLAAPRASWAQPKTGAAVFYASVGPVLTLYHVVVDGSELTKQGSRGAVPEGLLDVDLSQCSFCELAGSYWSIPDASSLGLDSAPIVDHGLTRAQQDNSEVRNHGRDNLPSYSCRCVHRHRDLGVRPQAQSPL